MHCTGDIPGIIWHPISIEPTEWIANGKPGGFHPWETTNGAEQPNPVLAAFSNCTVFKPRHGFVPIFVGEKNRWLFRASFLQRALIVGP
jgi:hypothetical protein